MKKLILLTTTILFAALLTACSSGLPKEMLDTTWEWQQLVETQPAAQSVILNSENYTIVFDQDGIYNAKADCNMLSGGYEVDGNQELVGIGSANLLAGLFQAFPISTSSSRTAVAEQSGAKTQLTGVVAGLTVLAMLLFVPGLVRNMPQSALAAIVIAASFSLFDLAALRRLWSEQRSEFIQALVCILSVALIGVLEGIVIAVVVSMLQFFRRAWQPYYAVLGKTKDVAGYHDLERYPDGEQIPGLLMLRWDAPLFFANANIFRNLIREQIAAATQTPLWVLVAAEPITDVDSTAADMLTDLDLELNASGIHLVFAELKDPAREKIESYGLLDTIDSRHFYPTLEVAVEEFYREVRSDAGVDLPSAQKKKGDTAT